LRVQNFPNQQGNSLIPYLIVGGGISGLSAADNWTKKGINILMVELEDHLGGNSSNGENKYLISPWRALLAPAKY
jgi:heterodisulfide reductase subunit A-like polyferredoxin